MGREFSAAFRRATRVLVGLGIGTFAVEAGRFAIDMADKFELSRSRLETVTKNLGGNFDAVSGKIQALDDRLAAFGFTNADVEGSVASLETATKSVSKAIQDTALAADIARGRNISLEAANLILMRVETGHVSMLSRLGIAVKDSTGHMLTQKQALEELARTYGGSASHFADSFAGKQQALRAELGNSAAEIGVALLPAAVDLAHVLQVDILPAIEGTAKWFDRNRKILEPLVGTVIKLTLAYKGLKAAQKLAGALAGGGAVRAAEGAAATEAYSLARPLPVYVVNMGGKVPTVLGKAEKAGETAAVEGGALAAARRFAGKIGPNAFKGGAYFIIGDTLLSFLPSGQGKSILGDAVKGAAVGRLAGPYGAVAGAVIGSGAGVTSKFVSGVDSAGAKEQAQYAQMSPAALRARLARLKQIASNYDVIPPDVKFEIDAVTKALQGGTTAADGHAKALEKDGKSAQHAEQSLKQYRKELDRMQKRALSITGAQDDLRQAVHNMAQTVASQSSRALRGNSDAALANRDALRGAVQSALDYVDVLKASHVNADKVRAVEYQMAKAILQNADATYKNRGQVVALLKQLEFLPSQIKRTLSSTYAIGYNAMVDLAKGISAAGNYPIAEAQGIAEGVTNKLMRLGDSADGNAPQANYVAPKLNLKFKKLGIDLGGNFSSGFSDTVDKGVSDAMQKATSKAQGDAQKIVGFFRQEKQSLISTFNDLSGSNTDLLGTSQQAPLLGQLRQEANKIHTFTRLWMRLDDKGLNPRLLDLFEGLGPEAIPTMRDWLNHPRKIRRASRFESQIAHDAGRLAQTDTQDKYGRLIHEDLTSLPRKIEHGFERALKRGGVRIDRDHKAGQAVQHS